MDLTGKITITLLSVLNVHSQKLRVESRCLQAYSKVHTIHNNVKVINVLSRKS